MQADGVCSSPALGDRHVNVTVLAPFPRECPAASPVITSYAYLSLLLTFRYVRPPLPMLIPRFHDFAALYLTFVAAQPYSHLWLHHHYYSTIYKSTHLKSSHSITPSIIPVIHCALVSTALFIHDHLMQSHRKSAPLGDRSPGASPAFGGSLCVHSIVTYLNNTTIQPLS